MAKEIERKFLVHSIMIDLSTYESEFIDQGYMTDTFNPTMRVRIHGQKAELCVKGPNDGIERAEFEYSIPLTDAQEMMKFCIGRRLTKTRYHVNEWSVDVFHGKNAGLVLAEIELDHAEQQIEIPSWIGEEVSNNIKYYNCNLV